MVSVRKLGVQITSLLLGLLLSTHVVALSKYYGTGLCDQPGYKCVTLKRGQSWEQFLPDPEQRDIVQKLNRTNMYLWRGRKVVMPESFENLTALDIAPFERSIQTNKEQVILVDQEKLAWGAYDQDGNLVRWGPISSGRNICSDNKKRSCNTVTGIFYVNSKKGYGCRSNIYPVGRGGSHMPYCMFFYRGFALHGSATVPGYRDSHGCVRLFTDDAKWLNHEFVTVRDDDTGVEGTKVIVQALTHTGGKDNG